MVVIDELKDATAAIYGRVSTSGQADHGTSMETQIDAGLGLAKQNGWPVPDHLIFREDRSGSSLDRPELNRLVEAVRRRECRIAIIYTMDRLYRSKNEGDEWRVFQFISQLEEGGAQVIFVDPTIPTTGRMSASWDVCAVDKGEKSGGRSSSRRSVPVRR